MDGPASQDAMTQYKFNLMARSVNKDFVQLGYPTILTYKDGRDFVSLCSLMLNCSNLLCAFKAKSPILTVSSVTADSCGKLSAAADQSTNSKLVKRGSSTHSKRRGGIFSSSSSRSLKQMHQQNAESLAKLSNEVARAMQFDEEFTSVYEGIVETVRRDTEFIIETTRCLPELEPAAAEGDQQKLQSRNDQTLNFFSTRWIQFRETLTERLMEAPRLITELQAQRLNSASGEIIPITDITSEGYGELKGARRDQGKPPRQRSLSRVSVTKIPSLEAEIRRLKLEINRCNQRHKEELDQHAKDRERMIRELRQAQRRNSLSKRLLAGGPQPYNQQHLSYQSHNSESSGKILTEVCQMLDVLADSLGAQASFRGNLASPLVGKLAGNRKTGQQPLQANLQAQQIQVFVESVCNAALSRIHSLQADCHSSRRRQADLEVLISILKARLDLSNDQLSDVAKFESVVNDIASRLGSDASGVAPQISQLYHTQSRLAQPGCDEHKDNLVSRLTHRLRERQKPGSCTDKKY